VGRRDEIAQPYGSGKAEFLSLTLAKSADKSLSRWRREPRRLQADIILEIVSTLSKKCMHSLDEGVKLWNQ
jgi:hypothetical protein